MLLKDKIKEALKNLKKPTKHFEDKIKQSVMDGFVDIKGYDKDGNLFYHDCGDNVVTDWMRHAIIQMLAGVTYVSEGDQPSTYANSERSKNPDAYVFSGYQYDSSENAEAVGNATMKRNIASIKDQSYAVFPTKILLGTGKEYNSWDDLASENSTENAAWYNEMVNVFGSGNEADAKNKFDTNITNNYNTEFSGSVANGVHSGDGLLMQARTVNDPSASTSEIASAISMYRNYNVVGAVKTPYYGDNGSNSGMLNNTISESGRLLKPEYRGIGKPAFIYFNQLDKDASADTWENGGEITLSKDESNKFLTKLTFSFSLPQQDSATSATGHYYPYNGWQIKQIGLYNDSKLLISSKGSSAGTTSGTKNDGSWYANQNMPYGMLLAVKNIAPFTKTAGTTYRITWTLTI